MKIKDAGGDLVRWEFGKLRILGKLVSTIWDLVNWKFGKVGGHHYKIGRLAYPIQIISMLDECFVKL